METNEEKDFAFAIDLPIRNEWSNVDLVRSSIENCFSAVFHDLDGCRTLAIVAGELLENAVKYGDWGAQSTFRLRVWGKGNTAHVMVENRVRPEGAQVAELLATLEWMKGFATPEEAFRARLLQIAQAPRAPDESGLGLVRIAYEANCTIGAELSGAVLRVTAKVGVGGKPATGA
jgi:hypothetical protein